MSLLHPSNTVSRKIPKVLSLVNTVSSTSIPVEIAHAINRYTDSEVTIGAVMQGVDVNLDPDIKSMDLPIVFFDCQSNFDPQAYKRLNKHIRSTKYDIVHTHHNFSGSVSRIIGELSGVKIINTEHNDHRYFTVAQKAVNAATYMLPDINVYNSESTKSLIDPVARKFSQRDEVIYNGIEIDRIDRSRDYTLPVDLPDGTLIANVGVMTEQKNQQAILEAAHKVKQDSSIEDVYFVIAGSGPLAEKLQTKATQLQIDDIVFFTGYLPEREHIYKLLHQADVFVTPSIYEGFCVAALEAMACGLPVIASDLEVFKEVIGEHGVFVPHSDTNQLATEIKELVGDLGSQEIQQKRKKLQERAENEFPIENTAKEYHELYLDVIE